METDGLMHKVSDYLEADIIARNILIRCRFDKPACQLCVVFETFWMEPTLLKMAENLFGLFQAENAFRNGMK